MVRIKVKRTYICEKCLGEYLDFDSAERHEIECSYNAQEDEK